MLNFINARSSASLVCGMAGLCASVLREPGQTPAAGAASASVTASVFAAGMAESCMDMSMLPDGDPPAPAHLRSTTHTCSAQMFNGMCDAPALLLVKVIAGSLLRMSGIV